MIIIPLPSLGHLSVPIALGVRSSILKYCLAYFFRDPYLDFINPSIPLKREPSRMAAFLIFTGNRRLIGRRRIMIVNLFIQNFPRLLSNSMFHRIGIIRRGPPELLRPYRFFHSGSVGLSPRKRGDCQRHNKNCDQGFHYSYFKPEQSGFSISETLFTRSGSCLSG